MSLKRISVFILILLVLAACTPVQGSQAVQLPEAISLAIGIGVLTLITFGLKYIFELTGLDLRGYGTALAVTISAFVVAQLQGWIDAVPAQYDPVLTTVLQIIVVILGSLGVLKLIHKDQPARLI